MTMTVVVADDVSDDRRRARRRLQQRGTAPNGRCSSASWPPASSPNLFARVTDMIDTSTDSVYAFRQRGACWETVGIVSQATVDDDPHCWAVL